MTEIRVDSPGPKGSSMLTFRVLMRRRDWAFEAFLDKVKKIRPGDVWREGDIVFVRFSPPAASSASAASYCDAVLTAARHYAGGDAVLVLSAHHETNTPAVQTLEGDVSIVDDFLTEQFCDKPRPRHQLTSVWDSWRSIKKKLGSAV